jgi:hypothetical protein
MGVDVDDRFSPRDCVGDHRPGHCFDIRLPEPQWHRQALKTGWRQGLPLLWLRIVNAKARACKSHGDMVASQEDAIALFLRQSELPHFLAGLYQGRTEQPLAKE